MYEFCYKLLFGSTSYRIDNNEIASILNFLHTDMRFILLI